MYCGLKLTSISFQASYFATGRKSNGAQVRTARNALSAATWKNGLVLRLSTFGSAESDPSCRSRMCTSTLRSCASVAPDGSVQHCARRARRASSSFCDSRGAVCLGSNLGCGCGGFFCGTGILASSFFGSGFFASSFLSASAMGSGLGSGFFSASCGFGSARACGTGTGFGSGTLGSGGASGISAEAVTISGLSTTFWAGLSTGLGSAIFSTNGFGAGALGAAFEPAMSSENSVAEMISMGSESTGMAGGGFVPNDTTHHSTAAAWPMTDMVSPVFIGSSGALLDLRHQSDAAEAGLRQPPHHAHDGTVIDFSVAANVDSLVQAAARLGDGLQLGH